MRKESFAVGSFVHVVKRGARGLPIVRDEKDRKRFLHMLTHLNDSFNPFDWSSDVFDASEDGFVRPAQWPSQERLVDLIAFCLVENHFHLILKEIVEGGVSRFMHRVGTAMTKGFNERHGEQGSLFQGAYRLRNISDDRYFRYVTAYVQVKNGLELFPGGFAAAKKNLAHAFEWLEAFPYSSYGDYCGEFERPIVQKEFLNSLFTKDEYRSFCEDVLKGRRSLEDSSEELEKFLLD